MLKLASNRFLSACLSVLCVACIVSASPLAAQSSSGVIAALRPVPQQSRIAAHPDLGPQTKLTGHLPGWIKPSNLSAQSVDQLTTLHLSMILRRAPEVQAAFEALLANQQNPSSPYYHQWLTPQQVGTLYGPTQSDVDAIAGWVSAQGLKVDSIAASRMIFQISGSVTDVGNAFRTSFSYYILNGKPHLAANAEPSIPTALAGVIRVVDGLVDLPPEPASHGSVGRLSDASQAGKGAPAPLYTYNSTTHYIVPNDFSVIYDIASVYSGGNTGATIGSKAQHIAVIDRSDVAATDISEWATNVGIASYKLNTILATGVDPGQTADGDQLESTLDVNRTLSTANGATTDLVVAPNSTGGIYAAAEYNVNTLVDPIMSISFYGCEANYGSSGVAAWDTLFETGAAEGISTFVCAGDSGAAGCASDFSTPPATTPVLSVNYICSSSYDTCMGGTEFNDTANPSLYWSSTNGTGKQSALSYIPEGAWNEPQQGSSFYIQSGGGGVSKYITKPTWQTGTGVPADGYRDQPDLSFTSAAHDGYYSCLAYSGGNCATGYFEYLAGTSAATPDMAAITALLNTRAGTSQGNMNPLIYKLAASAPAVFHDVTVSSSGVSSCSASVASMCNNSTPSQTALTGGLAGYDVTAGYDQSTGWGSLDVADFLAAAVPVSTTLTLSPATTTITTTQTASFTATLKPAASSVAAPSGNVQFYSNGVAFGAAIPLANDVSSSVAQTFAPAGTYNITAIYSGDSYFTTSTATAVSLTVTSASAITLTPASSSLTFTSGATTGNTDAVTVAGTGGFAGTVSLNCSISSGSAAYPPSCSISPTSVLLSSGGSSTAVVTISSTTAHAALDIPSKPRWRDRGTGIVLAMLLGWIVPIKRRRIACKGLTLMLFAIFGLLALNGCSSSNTSNTSGSLKSSAGSYTVTVTGASGSQTAQTTFSLTIQ
jgi:subtilase family serine protease